MLAAGVGLEAFSGGAAAKQADRGKGKLRFVKLEPSIETDDDGNVTSFSVSGTVHVEYKRLGMDARNIAMRAGVKNPNDADAKYVPFTRGNQEFVVADTDSLGSRAGEVSWDFGPYDVFDKTAWEPSDFKEGKVTPVQFQCVGAIREGTRNNGGQKSLYDRDTVPVRP